MEEGALDESLNLNILSIVGPEQITGAEAVRGKLIVAYVDLDVPNLDVEGLSGGHGGEERTISDGELHFGGLGLVWSSFRIDISYWDLEGEAIAFLMLVGAAG